MNNRKETDFLRLGEAIALAAILMILVFGWIGFHIKEGFLTNKTNFGPRSAHARCSC